MNEEYFSMPDDNREWVPIDEWHDESEPYLLAAAVESEANYAYYEDVS